jgi:hypothetical protein
VRVQLQLRKSQVDLFSAVGDELDAKRERKYLEIS